MLADAHGPVVSLTSLIHLSIESNVTVDVPGQKRKDRKDRGDGDYGDGDEDFGDVGGAVTQEEEDIQMATAMSLNAHERE